MKKIRAILVDDELDSLRAVQEQIKLYCPEVAIAGVFDDSLKGFKAIEALKPDVVFFGYTNAGHERA